MRKFFNTDERIREKHSLPSDTPIYEIGYNLSPGMIYNITLLLRNGKKVEISKGTIEKARWNDENYYLRVMKGHLDDGRSIPLENRSFLTFSEGTKFLYQ